MTDGTPQTTPEPTPPTSAAPATPAPTESAPSTPPAESNTPATPEFVIPDEYKDAAWASKVKNLDDLFKAHDGAQRLIGKKSLLPDPASATDEEWESFVSQTRPADSSVYTFDETTPEAIKTGMAEALHKHGIPARQANALMETYGSLAHEFMVQQTSDEGFATEMSKSFGKSYDATVAAVDAEHRSHLSPEDMSLIGTLPNETLGVLYRLTAAMQKAYGVQKPIDQTEGGNTQPAVVDKEATRKEIRTKMRELDTKPHTAAEKAKLQEELDATYR